MAINKTEEQTSKPQSPQAKQFVNPNPASKTNTPFNSHASLRSLRQSPISRGGVSEIASQIVTRFRKRFEDFVDNDKEYYRVHLLDNKTSQCYYSTVLICKAFQTPTAKYAVAYGILIEASAPRLQPRNFNYNGQQYSLQTAPSDAIDEHLSARIKEQLSNAYGNETIIALAGIQVLPTEFTLGDENSSSVDQLLFNAIQAVSNEPVKYGVVTEMPAAASLILQDGQPVIGKDPSPPVLVDIAGMPIRSDFNIRLGQKAKDSQNVWNPNEIARPDLTLLHGYVDLVYRDLPQSMPGQQMHYPQGLNPEFNKFIPRMVVTKLDVLTEVINSELILLALSTASFIKYNENWLEAFHPRASHDDINLRDITAIGFDTPLMGQPMRLDVQGMSDIPALNCMLLRAIAPDLLISIDYDEASEQSWMLSDFYHAAVGPKPADPVAVSNIVNAADRLTDGRFTKRWDGSQPIAYDENNRIALGYWVGNNGEKRDIRELDYLAMLNLLGDRDHSRVKDWDDTFNSSTGIPLDVRLERRERIAREVLPTYTLKGWARRLVINAKFLEDLTLSLADAGLVPMLESVIADLTGRTMRGNPALLGLAMQSNPANAGFYSAGRTQSQFTGIGAFNYNQNSAFRGFGQ